MFSGLLPLDSWKIERTHTNPFFRTAKKKKYKREGCSGGALPLLSAVVTAAITVDRVLWRKAKAGYTYNTKSNDVGR